MFGNEQCKRAEHVSSLNGSTMKFLDTDAWFWNMKKKAFMAVAKYLEENVGVTKAKKENFSDCCRLACNVLS